MAVPHQLAQHLREEALALGFARIGFAPVERFEEASAHLAGWLAAGYAGTMSYLRGPDDRADPGKLLDGARTLISVALACSVDSRVTLRRSRDGEALLGRVAAYAVGTDYHLVLKEKLAALAERCSVLAGRPVAARACVDTAPLLEREAARRAGIGFTGKSTLTIAPGLGTRFLLGELLVDVEIPPSDPVAAGCGRCTACLDACPTGAFVGPYVLDARRCISYLTIENTGSIPRDLRALVGNRVFGCDECQDVCPFNGSAEPPPGAPELRSRPELQEPDLVRMLALGAADYRKLVKRTALRRVGKRQLQRNAAVALGNSGDPRAVAPLSRSLAVEPSALVRAHAAWALGRLGGEEARRSLRAALDDPDPDVRNEASLALAEQGLP